jgi:hypothetical protein
LDDIHNGSALPEDELSKAVASFKERFVADKKASKDAAPKDKAATDKAAQDQTKPDQPEG